MLHFNIAGSVPPQKRSKRKAPVSGNLAGASKTVENNHDEMKPEGPVHVSYYLKRIMSQLMAEYPVGGNHG